MSGKPDQWTRRQFGQAVAASSLLGWKVLAAAPDGATGFAFVGSSPEGIHVFRVSGSRWSAVQSVAAAAPVHLVAHPTLPVLYAVHNVGLWNNLPRGAISAYAIAPATGQLTLIHTQPLSLSATYPRYAAVSPDGRYLFVAAERGSIYNLLPIASDGALEPPSAIRKECGLDQDSPARIAAPNHAVFHPDGATILTADTGQQAISTFSFDHESLNLRHRMRTHPGGGPAQIALSPAGDLLYALHATDGSVAVYRTGSDLQAMHAGKALHPGPASMAMHPSGRFLVAASLGWVTSLSIDADSGHLSKRSAVHLAAPLQLLSCPSDGTQLLGTTRSSGHVVRLPFNATAGTLGKPEIVAQVDGVSSLLFHPAGL